MHASLASTSILRLGEGTLVLTLENPVNAYLYPLESPSYIRFHLFVLLKNMIFLERSMYVVTCTFVTL
jgi:hypothetical protein